MLSDYADIRSRIPAEPLWFDEHGVPRYDPFTPGLAGIYGDWAVLMEIACQACSERMLVGFTVQKFRIHEENQLPQPSGPGAWHYGDPPRHECPGAGETMNCEDLRIVEFWRRDLDEPRLEWVRCPELEFAWPS